MEIVVTCAAGAQDDVARVGSAEELREALASGRPILVAVQ